MSGWRCFPVLVDVSKPAICSSCGKRVLVTPVLSWMGYGPWPT